MIQNFAGSALAKTTPYKDLLKLKDQDTVFAEKLAELLKDKFSADSEKITFNSLVYIKRGFFEFRKAVGEDKAFLP